MDNKRLIITVTVLMALVLTWNQIFIYVGKRAGWDMNAKPPLAQTPPSTPTTSIASATTSPEALGATTGPAGAATTPSNELASVIIGSTASSKTGCPLGLSLTTRGAGLNSVVLNEFKQTIDNPTPFTFQLPHGNYPDQSRPLSTQSITIDGVSRELSDVNWKLDASTDRSATFSLDLFDAGKPSVHVVKTYLLFDQTDVSNGAGYEVSVTQSVTNETGHPMSVSSKFVGPTPPPREMERGGDRQVITGYLQNDVVDLVHHTVEEFADKKATKDLAVGENNALLAWAGTCSGYFDAIVRPLTVGAMTHVTGVGLNPSSDATEHDVIVTYNSEATVAPGATSAFPVRAFFGPKKRTLLKSSYYSNTPLHYDSTLVMSSGPCSYITSDMLISVLVNALLFFHFILFKDWGLAIIAVVVCVRSILHPIMKRSQANMMKMGKMGPEIERLKKKYGDDKDAVAKAQMQLMKEQGFTPILGCLPLFLQMPIFIALWSCLQSTFELRQAPFLYFFHIHFTWIKDLSQPDKLISFPNTPINFLFIHLNAINLLPILVAIVSFINQKVTPKPPAATPEAAQQQKMMQWMTLVFPLMFYNLPSGLNLYYVTSTSLGIVEGKIIRKHIKDRDDAEKGDRIIVDAKPTRGAKMKKRDEPPKDQPKPGGFRGWIASLQEKAEQLQRDAERRNKDRA